MRNQHQLTAGLRSTLIRGRRKIRDTISSFNAECEYFRYSVHKFGQSPGYSLNPRLNSDNSCLLPELLRLVLGFFRMLLLPDATLNLCYLAVPEFKGRSSTCYLLSLKGSPLSKFVKEYNW